MSSNISALVPNQQMTGYYLPYQVTKYFKNWAIPDFFIVSFGFNAFLHKNVDQRDSNSITRVDDEHTDPLTTTKGPTCDEIFHLAKFCWTIKFHRIRLKSFTALSPGRKKGFYCYAVGPCCGCYLSLYQPTNIPYTSFTNTKLKRRTEGPLLLLTWSKPSINGPHNIPFRG